MENNVTHKKVLQHKYKSYMTWNSNHGHLQTLGLNDLDSDLPFAIKINWSISMWHVYLYFTQISLTNKNASPYFCELAQ